MSEQRMILCDFKDCDFGESLDRRALLSLAAKAAGADGRGAVTAEYAWTEGEERVVASATTNDLMLRLVICRGTYNTMADIMLYDENANAEEVLNTVRAALRPEYEETTIIQRGGLPDGFGSGMEAPSFN